LLLVAAAVVVVTAAPVVVVVKCAPTHPNLSRRMPLRLFQLGREAAGRFGADLIQAMEAQQQLQV
jgi:hypothetical protein